MSSSNVSLTDMRRNVEQLKLQAGVERIKVRMERFIILTEEMKCTERVQVSATKCVSSLNSVINN